jgi:hypothetical protein
MRVQALDLLADLRNKGIELVLAGDRIRFRPVQAVSSDLREQMIEMKNDLLDLLAIEAEIEHGVRPDDLTPEWREMYEERAAVRHFDGGQAIEHAEAEALAETLAAMRTTGHLESRP